MLGESIAHYTISAKLGEGGMGVVYLAKDSRLDRNVAIKLLPPHLTSDTPARERLRREAASAAALDHPFICKVFEIGEHQGALFIVLEYVPGITLHQRLCRGPLTLPEALAIAGEIAEALEAAHDRRFIHRDLKPANIMLTPQGRVKVMDFGLAKRLEPEYLSIQDETMTQVAVQLTGHDVVLGTPDYMSPEQAKGLTLDARSDLFSFGILLVELLGRRHPFRRETTADTLSAILGDPPDLRGDLPQGLMVMIRRLLAKDREERYESMQQVRSDLARMAATSLAPENEAPAEDRIPLFGRDAERKELLRLLDESLSGRGAVVMIGGEPGIGKTHLITAILDEAKRRGAFANIGHCYEMEGSPPYIPFIEMLEHAVRATPREGLRLALGDAASEVAKLMPELRRIFPDIPAAIELPAEQQRRFLFNAYREFVERAAKTTPIVAVFEDLHWADEPTLLLLQHLAQLVGSTPLLIIGTYRDVELDVTRPFVKTLESMVRQKQAVRISLRRLPVAGVEQMIEALSGQKVPPSLVRVVFEETEGNPFFVEEVFRHLAEEGMLFDESGAFRSGLRVDQLQVPEGVRLVLGRRLERLGEEARKTLTTAAVIGRVFPLRLLEALEPSRPDCALDSVEEGERARLVVAEPAGRETRYKFVHELVRQTLAETLSLPRRQRLHARIASTIEQVYAAAIDAHVPALAHHYYQAGAAADQEKTILYLKDAARRTAMAAAHEETLHLLDNLQVLIEGENSVREAELLTMRAGVLRSLGREYQAISAYVRAIDLFEHHRDSVQFLQANFELLFIYSWKLRFDEVSRLLDRAEAVEQNPSLDVRSLLLAQRGAHFGARGAIDKALEFHSLWRAIPESEVSLRTRAICLLCEAHTRLHSAEWNLARRFAQDASKIFERIGDLWHQAETFYIQFSAAFHNGEFSEGSKELPDAVAFAIRVGHPHTLWIGKSWQGVARAAMGDLDGGTQSVREGVKLGEDAGAGWVFSVRTFLAACLIVGDGIAEALPLLKSSMNAPETFWKGYADSLFGLALAVTGDRGALAALRAAVPFLPRPGCSRGQGCWGALAVLVQGFSLLGYREEAGRLLEETEKVAGTEAVFVGEFFHVRTVAGIAAAGAKQWRRAEEHHLAALEWTNANHARTVHAIAKYWYADFLVERGEGTDRLTAHACLQDVVERSESIGLALFARLARERMLSGGFVTAA